MESSTKVSFITDASSILKLVFNSGCNLVITVDGIDYTIQNGVLELNLSEGTHTITKKDTNVNIFYMSVSK